MLNPALNLELEKYLVVMTVLLAGSPSSTFGITKQHRISEILCLHSTVNRHEECIETVSRHSPINCLVVVVPLFKTLYKIHTCICVCMEVIDFYVSLYQIILLK